MEKTIGMKEQFKVFRTFNLYLEDVNNTPLTAPNVDIATNTGIIHAIGPYRRSAKV
jgi:hypothetical protein